MLRLHGSSTQGALESTHAHNALSARIAFKSTATLPHGINGSPPSTPTCTDRHSSHSLRGRLRSGSCRTSLSWSTPKTTRSQVAISTSRTAGEQLHPSRTTMRVRTNQECRQRHQSSFMSKIISRRVSLRGVIFSCHVQYHDTHTHL